jgi:hypothetical protein
MSPELISLSACMLMLIVLFGYIFFPQRDFDASPRKSQLTFLTERKDVVYENLRDLNFEHSAGKYPEADYVAMRASLEQEAASLLAEIDKLEQSV